jgi:hypothetical protein
MASSRRPAVRQSTFAALALALAASLATAPAFAHEGDTPMGAPPPSTPAAPLVPADSHVTPWPWVLAGAGALTLGTGIWMVSKGDSGSAMPACTPSPIGKTTCPYSNATTWQGWGVVAIGAQLAVAGAVWGVYQIRHRPKKSVSVVAGLGTVGLAGTF